MNLAALDINCDRAWALADAAGTVPRALPLDGEQPELALAISLERRSLEIGRAALSQARRWPHLICAEFLPCLGTDTVWQYGRHQLSADEALTQVFIKLRTALGKARGVVLALPAYLSGGQIHRTGKLAQEAGLKVTAAVNRLLAAGLHSVGEQAWHNVGLLVDVDSHALVCAVLRPVDAELRVLGRQVVPTLGLRIWKERLLAGVAERCIRQSRRDPRDSPDAEQMLFDQLDEALDRCGRNQPATLRVQAAQWFQDLTLTPAEAAAACTELSRRAADVIHAALTWAEEQLTSATVHFSAGAARLPGLAAAVYERCENKAPVLVLPPDGPARAALGLAQRIDQGDLEAGVFDVAAPLPAADRSDALPVIPFPKRARGSQHRFS